MKFLKITFITLVGALALITSGCSLQAAKKPVATNTSVPVPPFLAQDATSVQADTASRLAIAKAQAQVWKPDAVLVAYNVKVPTDLTSVETTQTFAFSSPTDTTDWWTISVDKDGKFVRALIPQTDYLGQGLQPIDESVWQKSYIEALQKAETSGGAAFHTANPEAQISLILEQAAPKNYLWWIVNYQGATNSLKVRISARDGNIYDDFGNPFTK